MLFSADDEPDRAMPFPQDAYPCLDAETIARMKAYGELATLAPNYPLFTRGDRTIDMYLVLSGVLEIYGVGADGERVTVVTYTQGQFTGELDLLNDRKILFSGRSCSEAQVIRIDRNGFRRLVVGEPDIAETLMHAFVLRRALSISRGIGGPLILGSRYCADVLRLRNFLVRNDYPFRTMYTDDAGPAADMLQSVGMEAADLPVVITTEQHVLANPHVQKLADVLGITEHESPSHTYQLAIVGAGPAGLAAAVYAASEGLDTVVIEGVAPGGQAGTSSKIENYPGFPAGISGHALATQSLIQAQKFGARINISRKVTRLDCASVPYRLTLDDGSTLMASAVIIATGASYRRLDLPNYQRWEGLGIHYSATNIETTLCAGSDVVVVGGGNSAGQAAVFLSRIAQRVHIIVRGIGLAETMSDYLVQRIEKSPSIRLHARSHITAVNGVNRLETVTWENTATSQTTTLAVSGLFVMIGAEPNTEWIEDCLDLDERGFIKTGTTTQNSPSPYATDKAGVFAIGDVRAGSIKRVSSGVGEGSMVVQAVHAFLRPELSTP